MLRRHHSRKYEVNEQFFDTWSPVVAYVLGFWFADGYMRKDKSYRILFFSNDLQIIRSIRGAMGSSHPIRKKSKFDQCWVINMCSKRLYQDLEKLGGISCKSKTLSFPNIPANYLRDFIRGYFDGDGSVFFVEYVRTKDKRRTRELRTNFTSGSRKFLESLMEVLQSNLGLPIKKLGVFNNGGSLKLGYGMKDSDTLLHYMYYDNFPIGLKRKADFVAKIPIYQKHFFKISHLELRPRTL
ncbi:MAG: LAGLIDADG family homing endonuclease [bacterium]|nr:LAGLIDADG family homing endonuclease [bacterium]